MDHVLAIDIGGTKMAAAIVDEAGRLSGRAQVPTAGADGESLLATLLGVVDEVRNGAGHELVGVGVGIGGPMAKGGVDVSPLNIGGWRAFPLLARLEEHTDLPVWIDNDAKALALGEGWLGGAVGVDDYLAMVVSTGVGGGIVLDGRLLDGEGGNAGHIGHVIVVPGGRQCGCGAHGCLEAEASGLAIARITGGPPREAPAEIRERTGRLVGRAVASVANLLDLRLACVAGSVALGYGEDFFSAAQSEVDASARLDHSRGTQIVPSGLGDAGPLTGAAAVAWRGLGRR
jgi:glucokinase